MYTKIVFIYNTKTIRPSRCPATRSGGEPAKNAKQADEHVLLDDLRGATKVVALTLLDLLGAVP
jgi:acetylornithine deacetylase/succinyl-diaminopimelate desuccinylase-like protein